MGWFEKRQTYVVKAPFNSSLDRLMDGVNKAKAKNVTSVIVDNFNGVAVKADLKPSKVGFIESNGFEVQKLEV